MEEAALQREAEARYGPGARVEGLVRLQGGSSRELWGFDVLAPGGDHALVLREDPPGAREAPARRREFAALAAAHAAGVPVPAPGWLIAGDAGLVMARLAGEAIPRRLLREGRYATARARLVEDVARAAAAIHAIAPETVEGLDAPAAPAHAALDALAAELVRLGEPHPALEVGLRLLRRTAPAPRPARLVHGDLRLGNLMVDEGGLVGVLDWELCHAGDPVEDLGWMCVRSWRFGADEHPALGVGTRAELLAAYGEAGGPQVAPQELRWWEAFGNLRWGVICVIQADLHLSGAAPSLERAAIGRRTCEPEWDLLTMLAGEDAADAAPPAPVIQDRPDAPELLAAVAQFLMDDVLGVVPAEQRFGVRIAANSVAIAAREAALEQPARAAARERSAALVAEIRAGAHDERLEQLVRELRAEVRAKLAVARPGYA